VCKDLFINYRSNKAILSVGLTFAIVSLDDAVKAKSVAIKLGCKVYEKWTYDAKAESLSYQQLEQLIAF
jgi:hypothetical protein